MACSGREAERRPLLPLVRREHYGGGRKDLADSSSGHGGQVKDKTGDEDDGYDECIYPVDFKRAGELVDDDSESALLYSF